MAKEKVSKEEEKEDVKDNCCRGKEYDYGHCGHKCKKVKVGGGCGGGIYGFGLIGALFYFFQHLGPATFGNVIVAIIKSIAWPALFVYKFLEMLRF
jgi:hypothetical protein